MHQVVNIPHASNKSARLTSKVDGQKAAVVVADDLKPSFTLGVCDLHIGDHMFEPHMRDNLRMMVADAIRVAITQGRDAGYAHAQSDFRNLLGVRQ
jgi:hypothetical protein